MTFPGEKDHVDKMIEDLLNTTDKEHVLKRVTEKMQEYLDESDLIIPMGEGLHTFMIENKYICELFNDFLLFMNDGSPLPKPLTVEHNHE